MTREQRQDVINLIGDIKEANLLDAAHEMLSVLRRVEIHLLQNNHIDADTQDVIDDVQAAIARADGKL